jgi:membrane protein implicated in regulation of membrane protease activity
MMGKNTRNAALAATAIMLGFGLVAFYMPAIMLSLGRASPVAGGIAAVLFVAAFFGVFWLRGRSQKNREERER